MEDIIKNCLPTYNVIKKIGEGVNGAVFLIKDSFNERAVKVVPIMVERSLSYKTKNELDSKISHDFHAVKEYYEKIKGKGVVEIYDFHLMDKQVSKQEAKAYLVILMEYCPDNLLDNVLDNYPLPPETAEKLMLELAQILRRLSKNSEDVFIVKDLKPSNLLVSTTGKLLVGDLGGLQRVSSISSSASAQFTPNWSAPELIIHSEAAGVSTLVYSYGFVSYFVWSGSLPYEKDDFTDRIRHIKEQGLRFNRSDIPDNIKTLIEKCLKFNPKERPKDFNDIIQILRGKKEIPIEAIAPSLPADNNIQKTNKSLPSKMEVFQHKGRATSAAKKPSKSSGPSHSIIGDTWLEPLTSMEFAWVPSGSFKMGSGKWDTKGITNERPVHEVYIDGFWMSKFAVTQRQWKRGMASTLWQKVKRNNPSWFKMGDDYPVEQVSWSEAQEFIQKLISLNKEKYHFRLPTEAEWEYAARSCGRNEKYAGGYSVEDVAWYSSNSGMTTKPAGTKKPNGIGLYDMSGNVYEWCEDIYNTHAYEKHESKNPCFKGSGSRRVIRGGSWCNFPSEMRCCYRASVNPDFKGNYLGLRLVMTSVSRKSKREA